VISGIGKSAVIAQKIVATFNSTGTPSLFMHAADAIHGDLGMIQQDDVVIILSKSGESPEIRALAQLIRNFGKYHHSNGGEYSFFISAKSFFDFWIQRLNRKLVQIIWLLQVVLLLNWSWAMHWLFV